MNIDGKRVIIIQQRLWGVTIGHLLAKNLQDCGCTLAAMSIKPSTHDFLLQQKEVRYAELISGDDVTNRAAEYIAGEDISLEKVCDDLSVDSVWTLIQGVRSFVKCYRDKYQFGFKQNLDDETIAVIVKAWYLLVRNLFETFRPDVVVAANYVSLIHIFFNLYARKKGIPMVAMTDCKYKHWCMPSYGYLDDEGPLFDRFEALQAGADNPRRDQAREMIAGMRENLTRVAPGRARSEKGALAELPYVAYRVAQVIWGRLRTLGEKQESVVATDVPSPRLVLRDYWQKHRNRRFAVNYRYEDLARLDKIVYFPLQVQPEMQLDVIAPRFNNLLEVVRQVAMSLPGDYTLVVKDHPIMVIEGLRTPGYIEKLARTPNVKLVDYRIPTRDIFAKADLVVNPNSTTLAEAAYYRIPAIQLGDLGTTKLFPNVFHHSDLSTLSSAIRKAMAADLTAEAYDRQLENFLSAVLDVATSLEYGRIWYSGTEEERQAVCDYFIDSIKGALEVYGRPKGTEG